MTPAQRAGRVSVATRRRSKKWFMDVRTMIAVQIESIRVRNVAYCITIFALWRVWWTPPGRMKRSVTPCLAAQVYYLGGGEP